MGPVARESRNLRGGSIPGTAAHPAFTLTQRIAPPVPVIIAVPHAGRVYPAEFAENFRHSSQASLRLEDRFADLVAEAVARETGASLLVAHAPRAMIDLNRAPDDIDWDMVEGEAPVSRTRHAAGRRARSGLGLVPRRLPGLGELWKQGMTCEELAARIEQVHQPYHAALSRGLESLRDRWGAALLIDLHSMPPLGPKRGSDAAVDFVIGDRFGASASSSLSAAAFDHFTSIGRRAAHNRPYAGGYVLDRHASPSRGLHALQLEICRATYLDSELREPGPGLEAITNAVSGLIRRLSGELIGGWGLPQAAE
ncbi:N-formylglutamate amidohydrolase [Altererythrobacter sp. Root672]|uniref:N-formylglutamate amidohydrolase n=1 Tax=Altererythrobacter sp. Root672 TaxID=1736584 RepID=UPI0006FD7E08|nr:N-formylglutamate amidohydrolase [Altererythrobacter sp. Root672]